MNKKMLRITELGTVCSSDSEMLTNKFLKKLEKNYQKDDYNVSFNEKDNNFNIKYDGIECILELDTETMKHYLKGNYNDITSRLKKIINAELDLEKKKQEQEEEKQKEFSIIEERLGPIVIDSEVIDGTLREREKILLQFLLEEQE